MKEYEDRVNRTIHEIVLNDEGIGNLEFKSEGLINLMSHHQSPKFIGKGTNKFRKIDTFKGVTGVKSITKGNLLSQHSTVLGGKRCKQSEILNYRYNQCRFNSQF